MSLLLFGAGSEEAVREWTAITADEILESSAEISCIPNEITWHGFAKINVTDDSEYNIL